MKEIKPSELQGEFCSYAYEITSPEHSREGQDGIYRAGNSRWESHGYLPLSATHEVNSLEEMQRYCNITGGEMAKELGITWRGCSFSEDLEDEYSELFGEPGRMSDGTPKE